VALGPEATTAVIASEHGEGEIGMRAWEIVSIRAGEAAG
jgi:hypothetical protein